MTRALWLPDALRAEGVTVIEHAGWSTRGSSTFAPVGVVCHHTAGPASGDAPSLGICITGRGGRDPVPGPLAHVVLARSGIAHVIASGRANHAGKGSWRGVTGNTRMFGIEAENTGRGEPWPAVQLDAYYRVVAAMCRGAGIQVAMVCGHKEWAPGRKPDPLGIDMDDFRRRVAARLGRPPSVRPAPTLPAPPKGPLMALTDKEQTELLDMVRKNTRENEENWLRLVELQKEVVVGDRPAKGTPLYRIIRALARIEDSKVAPSAVETS